MSPVMAVFNLIHSGYHLIVESISDVDKMWLNSLWEIFERTTSLPSPTSAELVTFNALWVQVYIIHYHEITRHSPSASDIQLRLL